MHAMTLILGYAALAQVSGAPAPQNADQLIVWTVILIGMSLVFLIAEMFVPSGGLLGACSFLCMVGGVVMLFRLDTAYGVTGIIVSLIAIPCAFFASLYIMPRSPIGRALTLGSNDDPEDSAYDGQVPPPQQAHKSPFEPGEEGKALTDLRPVGTCLIKGQRCECLSESGQIRAGTKVRVVHADPMQVKVRPIDGD